MAKRAKVITEEDVPVEEAIKEVRAIEEEEEKQLEIEEFLAEFRGKFSDQPAKVLIEKFEDSEWTICKKYPLSTFDHESVRDEFGGGRYRAILIGADGRYIKAGRNYFKFAQAIVKPLPLLEKPSNPLDNPVVVMIIEAQKAQSAQMLEITKSMIAASQGGGGKSDVGQIITAMKGLQDLAPKDKPLDNFKDTLNMMKLVKEVTGDSDSKGGLLSEIRQFLEVYPTIKEQLAAIKPPAGPISPAVAPPVINNPERSTPVLDPLSQKIVQLVPKYVEAGKKALPVEDWGQTLLDDVDLEILPLLLPVMKRQYGPLVKNEDDVYDILLRYAGEADEREKIFKEIPPLAAHREWTNRVIEEAMRLATLEDPGDVVTNAVTGNGKVPSGPLGPGVEG